MPGKLWKFEGRGRKEEGAGKFEPAWRAERVGGSISGMALLGWVESLGYVTLRSCNMFWASVHR